MSLVDNDSTPPKLHTLRIVLPGGQLDVPCKYVSHMGIITPLGCDHDGAGGHFVETERSRFRKPLQHLSIASGDDRKVSFHLATGVLISQVPIAQTPRIGQVLSSLLSPSTNNCQRYQYEIRAATRL